MATDFSVTRPAEPASGLTNRSASSSGGSDRDSPESRQYHSPSGVLAPSIRRFPRQLLRDDFNDRGPGLSPEPHFGPGRSQKDPVIGFDLDSLRQHLSRQFGDFCLPLIQHRVGGF